MTTEALKTTAITNLDATPPVRATYKGQRKQVEFATISPTTGKTTGSTYQMFRLPSNANLHSLKMWLDAGVTTFAGDVTLYYSDIAGDGTDASGGTGLVTAHVFQTAFDFHAIVAPAEMYLGGNLTGAKLGQPLWQQAALASDPGGFFDVVVVITSTTSGSPVLNGVCEYGAI